MNYDSIIKPPASRNLKSGRVQLQPGEAVGEHVTESKEELIIVMKGTATILKEGKPTTVIAGNTHYIPPETRHDVRNEGKEILNYLYVISVFS
ncbi:cupin domain-containing protein [Candidatus Woesearchaeota archaeon]|nr:cupin domain-containing protein [Candidatus Woesearchaeota archaeon]